MYHFQEQKKISALQLTLWAALMTSFLSPITCYAEEKVITAEASYIMGDGETPSFAEAMVLQKAKQTALEEAGTYVQSYTTTRNLDVTVEEIQVVTGGLLKTEVLKKTRTLVGDVVRFDIVIKATIEIERMEELARRVRGKDVAKEYAKLQAEYAKLARDLEDVKRSLANLPSGPDHDTALERLRSHEKTYRSIEKREGQFFERLASGSNLYETALAQLSDKQTRKNAIDAFFDKLFSNGYLITLGDPDIKTFLYDRQMISMRISVAISITETGRGDILETLTALGSKVVKNASVDMGEGTGSTPSVLLTMPEDIDAMQQLRWSIERQTLVLEARLDDGSVTTCYLPSSGNPLQNELGFGLNLATKMFRQYRVGESALRTLSQGDYLMVPIQGTDFLVSMDMPIEKAKHITSFAAKLSDISLRQAHNSSSKCKVPKE